MRRAVDAARQATHDADARRGERARERLCHPIAIRSRASRTDDGDRRARQQREVAVDEQERWRIGQVEESARIIGVLEQHEARTARVTRVNDPTRFVAEAVALTPRDGDGERLCGGPVRDYAL